MNLQLLFVSILHILVFIPDIVTLRNIRSAKSLQENQYKDKKQTFAQAKKLQQKRSIKFEWESSPSKTHIEHKKHTVAKRTKRKKHKKRKNLHYTKTLVKKTYEDSSRRRTDILTPKYHVTITERFPRARKRDENAVRRSEFIAANDQENELAEEPVDVDDKDNKKSSNKEIIENNNLEDDDEVLTKAYKHVMQNRKDFLSQVDPKEPILKVIVKQQKKKKKLTKLFVRFMSDMTQKLKLDPLTVADMIVKGEEKRSKVKTRSLNRS